VFQPPPLIGQAVAAANSINSLPIPFFRDEADISILPTLAVRSWCTMRGFPNDMAIRKCSKVSGDLVVLVDLKFSGTPCFNDEHFVSYDI